MNLNDAFPSNYLKATDLQNREIKVTIDTYKIEKIGEDEGKLVLYFKGKDKGLVCNKTNATRIGLMHGDDLDAWRGKEIVLGTDFVEYQGKTTKAIRVKDSAATPAPASTSDKPFEDEIPF
jgi:hypothetical protein